jgi:hypothetical protein
MRTILFLDDWPLQDYRGLVRRWFQAEPWPGYVHWHDRLLAYSSVSTVLRAPETGQWHMWGTGTTRRDQGDEGTGMCLYNSTDGLDWQPALQEPRVDRGATPQAAHIVFSGEYSGSGAPFYDAREPDPTRRYKLAYSDLSPRPVAPEGACRIATSPDGIHWNMDRQAVWREQHTDTLFSILDNPYTGQYQFTGRPILGDRRVALYQTRDWRTFAKPLVIVHPDPLDPPCVEFYGMPHFLYEGYLVGLLWRMHSTYAEGTIPSRMRGRVDCELAYSINGIQWNRTNRQSILPDQHFGGYAFGSEYPSSLVLDDEGWLRLYTTSCVGEHNDGRKFAPDEVIAYVTVSRWRRDGFCALESASDIGQMTLRPLIARGGEILLNAITGRFGKIRAELRMVPDNKPIPGYELENAIPWQGDDHFAKLRWKERDTTDPFRGEPFRLYLELDQARVYAVRTDADLLYGWVPETNLAGDYIPNELPGLKAGREGAYPKKAEES